MIKWLLLVVLSGLILSCSDLTINEHSSNLGQDTDQEASQTLGDVLQEVEQFALPEEIDRGLSSLLKAELAAALEQYYFSRTASATTTDLNSSSSLVFNELTNQLQWGYYSNGDYDQNGEVNVADLTPIALHFGQAGVFAADSPQAVIDGDGNGEINAADITPIAVNYTAVVDDYAVFTSSSADDYPETPLAPNGPGSTLLAMVPPEQSTGKQQSDPAVLDLAPGANGFFWVRPADGSDLGTVSNLLEVVLPPNLDPDADLAVIPANGDVPLQVNFDASGSSDADGQIVKYEFDWDGPENGEVWIDNGDDDSATFTYTTIGMFSAVVRVTDDRGGMDTAEVSINVTKSGNDAPLADIEANQVAGETPFLVIFDATASIDPDGIIVRHEWDFDGDGEIDEDSGSTSVTSNTYFKPGVFNAILHVYDDNGATDSAQLQISVTGNFQDWQMFRKDQRHSAISAYSGPDSLDHPFSFQTGGAISASPVIGLDGVVYIGSEDGYLYAIRPNGSRKWRFQANHPILSSAALDQNGHIYFGANNGPFYSVDDEGQLRWRVDTDGDVQCSPLITEDGRVYFGSGDGDMYCYTTSGSELWKFESTGQIFSSPVADLEGNIIFGHSTGFIYCLDPDGDEVWSYETGAFVESSPTIGADGTIYVGSDDHYLYALHSDGSFFWRFLTGDVVFSSPAVGADGTIYVGSLDGFMYAVEPDGSMKWQFDAGGQILSSPIIDASGVIYFGSANNHFNAITPNNTLVWSFLAANLVHSSGAIAVDGTLYFGSEDSFLHSLSVD